MLQVALFHLSLTGLNQQTATGQSPVTNQQHLTARFYSVGKALELRLKSASGRSLCHSSTRKDAWQSSGMQSSKAQNAEVRIKNQPLIFSFAKLKFELHGFEELFKMRKRAAWKSRPL